MMPGDAIVDMIPTWIGHLCTKSKIARLPIAVILIKELFYEYASSGLVPPRQQVDRNSDVMQKRRQVIYSS